MVFPLRSLFWRTAGRGSHGKSSADGRARGACGALYAKEMNVMKKPFNALIVGASRGLGLRLVQQYLERGWSVVATVRGEGALPAALDGEHPYLVVARLDVTLPNEIAELREKLEDRRFDLLFVVAGTTNDTTEKIGQVATEEFVRVMVTNALGPMRCVEVLSPLVHEKGTIAVMSSGLASVENNTSGGWEVYRASKAALNMMIRSFATRAPHAGQAILAVAPGWSRTDMGGAEAPLDPDDSVRGVIKTLDSLAGTGERAFVDYRGAKLPW